MMQDVLGAGAGTVFALRSGGGGWGLVVDVDVGDVGSAFEYCVCACFMQILLGQE